MLRLTESKLYSIHLLHMFKEENCRENYKCLSNLHKDMVDVTPMSTHEEQLGRDHILMEAACLHKTES